MKKILIAAVTVIAVTAAVFCAHFFMDKEVKLVLCYSDTDKVIKSFDVTEGMEFSVEFIHSVNKSPVKEVYVIRDGKIFADRLIYATFGAGMPTEPEEGQTLGYDDEGNMILSGINAERERVYCVVGTVHDHVLTVGGESISLTELCGKNARVYFELR